MQTDGGGFSWDRGLYQSEQMMYWRNNFLYNIGCSRAISKVSTMNESGRLEVQDFESSLLMQRQEDGGVAVLFQYPEARDGLVTLLMPEILSPVSYYKDVKARVDPEVVAKLYLASEIRMLFQQGYFDMPSPLPVKIIAPLNVGYHWKYSEINIERDTAGKFLFSGMVIDPLGGFKELKDDKDFVGRFSRSADKRKRGVIEMFTDIMTECSIESGGSVPKYQWKILEAEKLPRSRIPPLQFGVDCGPCVLQMAENRIMGLPLDRITDGIRVVKEDGSKIYRGMALRLNHQVGLLSSAPDLEGRSGVLMPIVEGDDKIRQDAEHIGSIYLSLPKDGQKIIKDYLLNYQSNRSFKIFDTRVSRMERTNQQNIRAIEKRIKSLVDIVKDEAEIIIAKLVSYFDEFDKPAAGGLVSAVEGVAAAASSIDAASSPAAQASTPAYPSSTIAKPRRGITSHVRK